MLKDITTAEHECMNVTSFHMMFLLVSVFGSTVSKQKSLHVILGFHFFRDAIISFYYIYIPAGPSR